MLKINEITSVQLVPEHITLSWQLGPTDEDLNNYTISIYRSELPSTNIDDYTLLASGINPFTTPYYNDPTIYTTNHKFVDILYIVMTSGIVSHDVYYSEPYGQTTREDKYAREIVRRNRLIMELHSGQQFSLLKRKSFGTYCTNCYDPILQRTTKGKCEVCYNTGYVGGFYAPMKLPGQMSERPTREAMQLFGTWQDQDATLYILGDPPVNPKDIIVDRLARRWIVLNVGQVGKSMHTTAQICQLRQIEREDVVYKVKVTY